MPPFLQFRHCVHKDQVVGDAEAIMAVIRGEICQPRAAPRVVDALLVYRNVGRVIGAAQLADLWLGYRSDRLAESGDPRHFATFLAAREMGKAHPALADLARLDLGLFLAGLDDREASIAPCCLPPAVITTHADLVLRVRPSVRYLSLAYPVHAWRHGPLPEVPGPKPVQLRLSPGPKDVRRDMLAPARFAFEAALARGRTLATAAARAKSHDAAFDPLAAASALVADGVVADVMLHPNA